MRGKFRGGWALAVVVLAAVGCSRPTKVEVRPDHVILREAGGRKNLLVTVLDQKGRPMDKAKITFASSAPDVAEVDASGIVKAKSSGEAIISATCGKATGAAQVDVKIVSSLKLALPDSGSVGPADTVVPLVVSGKTDQGEQAELDGIAFSSSVPQVATVDGKGDLTLLSTGDTVITATIGKATATLPVKVQIEVPAAVKVDKSTQEVRLGEPSPLDFMVLSDLGRPMKSAPLTCTSSNEKVLQVDAKGTATGVARGTAVVTIAAGTAKNTIRVVVR